MVSNTIPPRIRRKKWRFSKFLKHWMITLVFKNIFFRPKSLKITEIRDHNNIDHPVVDLCGLGKILTRLLGTIGTFSCVLTKPRHQKYFQGKQNTHLSNDSTIKKYLAHTEKVVLFSETKIKAIFFNFFKLNVF
jgi:hypothetical protein